ncbi:IST1 homolog [Hyperolius riggenbachi]|uniref:IST1 homolog n=1 Tax=Hyperolius riggenbachi TaxID=752182 RepID=UPI0035A2D36C
MFRTGFKAERLSSSLKASMAQLDKLKDIKSEMMVKTKKEVIEHLKNNRELRAMVRVEQIVREENLLLAMDIIRVQCDVLYKKIGLIQAKQDVEDSLNEAVSTLIWAAPHLETEVSELKKVADQLCRKYSTEYGNQCRANKMGYVNSMVIQKLSAESPPKFQVEKSLCDIAKEAGIEHLLQSIPGAGLPSAPGNPGAIGGAGGIGFDNFALSPAGGRGGTDNSHKPPKEGLPYPELSMGFPDVEKIMADLHIAPASPDSIVAPSNASEPPFTKGIGFIQEVLNDNQEPQSSDKNLPDVTSATAKSEDSSSEKGQQL